MDLSLSEEQEMLRKIARDFFHKEFPKDMVREMEEDEIGYSPELWKKMANLGWMGLPIPQEYCGMGSSFLDFTILLEEFGRALIPGPFVPTMVYCTIPIMKCGTEAQKEYFLPKIAAGELTMTLALTEPSATFEPRGVQVKAMPDGEDYVINGVKLFIPDAHVADWIICVARSREELEDEKEGISLFLVPGKTPGISCTPLKTIASDKQYEVTFENVRVPKENILGEAGRGWPIVEDLIRYAAVSQCALMLGGAQEVLDMTVSYAKERVQFDRPIGSFQAIQHKCANMMTDVAGIRSITYMAAWKLSKGLPAAMEVSMAKAWCNEAYRRVCAEGHQIHGGVGLIRVHDMQLYYRRAKVAELAMGDADSHREKVAQELGL
jgi:alkylation response protein AidB-like acyl-CoA dehydrogenase